MAKRRVQVFLEDADWDYLGQLSEVLGSSRSALMRDMIEQFTSFMRKALGDDLTADKFDVTRFMREMMLGTSEALSQVKNLPTGKPEVKANE